MRSCRLLQCCETPAEERSAGNPHATFCGNWRRATASSDPVIRLRPVPVSTNLARLSSQRVRPAPQANRPGAGGRAHQWAVFGSKGSSAGRRYGMNCAIPLRAMAAACRRPDGFQLKPAFFPNNPSEEFERQSVCRRGQNHALGVNQAG